MECLTRRGFFQYVMCLALGHLGPESGIISCMDDSVFINHTFEAHLMSLGKMFAASQAAGLTFKPSKIKIGQNDVD